MLKVGLIGCGYMGTMHVNCYKNIEGVELVALADIREEKAKELAAGTHATLYADGMDLINHAEVDAIDICLPTDLHAKYALAAMDKVKYLFVEKPVALTVEEGEAMLKKSAETGCRVQVGQVIRFWDEYVALKKIVRENKYGKVINANFRRISPTPTWGWNDWLRNPALSGGAGQDLYVHDVDYVLSLFGEPDALYSVSNTLSEKNSYRNSLFSYDGFCVSVEGTWDLPESHPFSATFRVVFENAVVENDGKFMLYTKDGAEEIKIEKKELALSGGTGGNISDLGGYYNELVYFTAQAKAGAPIEEAALFDGVASLKFLLEKVLSFGK